MLAVNWGSVAIWGVSIFLVVAVAILAVGAIFAILRGGCSQDTARP